MNAVAGIDIGTNSVRLLILDGLGQELDRKATVTGLGRGMTGSGSLSNEAIARTLECLRAYKTELFDHRVSRCRIVATSASRDASNGSLFLAQVNELMGFEPELLSGTDEGAFSFAGAMSSFEPRVNGMGQSELDLVVDIGGGSTEFIVGRPGEAQLPDRQLASQSVSLDMGCVRFTDMYLSTDPPSPEDLSGLISVAHAYLDDLDRELPAARDATRLVGVAGTIVSVAAIELGRYDRSAIHQMWLSRAAAEDVFRTVALEAPRDRAFNPGLHPDRVGTIVAGAAILVTILRHFDIGGLFVSETDLLDAITRSLL